MSYEKQLKNRLDKAKGPEEELDERLELYIKIREIQQANAISHGHQMEIEDKQSLSLNKQKSMVSTKSEKQPTESYYDRINRQKQQIFDAHSGLDSSSLILKLK